MRLRIVIFDDEPGVLRLLETTLARRGHQVTAYLGPGLCPLTTPGQCSCPPGTICADIIISDVQMPGTNGIDFLQQLQERRCRCPHRALMSGYWTDDGLQRAAQLGCHVFHKPFLPRELLEWVQHVEEIVTAEPSLSACSR